MLGNDKHAQAGRGIFMDSAVGLANVLAVVVSFLGTPVVFGKTVSWVQELTAAQYGHGYHDLIAFGWFCICALLLFYFARMSIGTAIIFGALAIATRFL